MTLLSDPGASPLFGCDEREAAAWNFKRAFTRAIRTVSDHPHNLETLIGIARQYTYDVTGGDIRHLGKDLSETAFMLLAKAYEAAFSEKQGAFRFETYESGGVSFWYCTDDNTCRPVGQPLNDVISAALALRFVIDLLIHNDPLFAVHDPGWDMTEPTSKDDPKLLNVVCDLERLENELRRWIRRQPDGLQTDLLLKMVISAQHQTRGKRERVFEKGRKNPAKAIRQWVE